MPSFIQSIFTGSFVVITTKSNIFRTKKCPSYLLLLLVWHYVINEKLLGRLHQRGLNRQFSEF